VPIIGPIGVDRRGERVVYVEGVLRVEIADADAHNIAEILSVLKDVDWTNASIERG